LNRDRFFEVGYGYWGLPSRDYSSFKCNPIPKFFSRRIIEFMNVFSEIDEIRMTEHLAEKHNLRTIQIKYYIQYCLEMGKLKRENGQLKYDENSIST
jgi:hypothetical protein